MHDIYHKSMTYDHSLKRSFGNPSIQLKMRAGVDSGKAVEDLVDSILFSDLQDVECLAWWKKMEPSLIAKGPAGVALVADLEFVRTVGTGGPVKFFLTV